MGKSDSPPTLGEDKFCLYGDFRSYTQLCVFCISKGCFLFFDDEGWDELRCFGAIAFLIDD